MLKLKIGRSKVADAPSPTNISENPNTKKIERVSIDLRRKIVFTERISSNDDPVKKHRYDGTIGKTHGDKKLIKPALNAIKSSNIIQYFSLLQKYRLSKLTMHHLNSFYFLYLWLFLASI